MMKNQTILKISILIPLLSLTLISCTRRFKARVPKPEPDIAEVSKEQNEPYAEENEVVTESFRFSDLPIPLGFSFDRSKSFIYETPLLKAGKLVYKGSESLRDLTEFFKEEMPSHGWDLVNIFEDQTILLNFSKEGWTCSVAIGKVAWTSYIEIKIGPS